MHTISTGKATLVGGGIASLAAAVYLIRDAGFEGGDIRILEADHVLGGSLDGTGNDTDGYLVRGGRMFEAHYGCTFDLLDGIPTLTDPDCSVTEEIKRFTEQVVTSSKCRLVIDGGRVAAPEFGLTLRNKWDLIRLSLLSERTLGDTTIAEYFEPHFFETNYWTMWCTMFAFQPWHSVAEMRRYVRRFMHLLPGLNRLEGIYRTRLNQFDSIVAPLVRWLDKQGVIFELGSRVMAVEFDASRSQVTALTVRTDELEQRFAISPDDKVFITLGSMTEASSLGSMTSAPSRPERPMLGTWALWQQIAEASTSFGRPDRFASDTSKTLWESFTVTLDNPRFFEFMESFTGNPAGTGGLVTFKHSGWLMSIVLAHQPHFANQGDDVFVFWGYGLHPHNLGDAIDKPMLECTGAEILTELAHQLGLAQESHFAGAQCIPCLMPYITTQFMPRSPGDRPGVVPGGAKNFAFIGQFCELPDDTVFTVEYSVRSAQVAVFETCAAARCVTPLYRGVTQPGVIISALRTLLRNGRARKKTELWGQSKVPE